MKNKIIQLTPSIIALLVIGFRYFSLWCTDYGHLCYRTWLDSNFLGVIKPTYFFFLYFLPIAVVLVLIPRSVFNSWLKLALWMLPIALIYIATTPVNFTGIGLNFFPFYRDDAARLAAEVVDVTSLLFIAWKYFSARREFRTV